MSFYADEEYVKSFKSVKMKLLLTNAELDSILGFEPSVGYTADRAHIEWKLRQIDAELSKLC